MGVNTEVQIFYSHNSATVIVCEEVHIESINFAVAFVVHDDRRSDGSVRFSICIWLCTFDPLRILRDVVFGGEVHIAAERVYAVQVQRVWTRDLVEIDFGNGVLEKDLKVCGEPLLI